MARPSLIEYNDMHYYMIFINKHKDLFIDRMYGEIMSAKTLLYTADF